MSKHRHVISRHAGGRLRVPRQVLKPGSRKAAVHPWALLLWAARNGAPEADLVALRDAAGIVR